MKKKAEITVKDDKKYLKSIESGVWSSVKDINTYKKHLQKAAEKTMLKDQRMKIKSEHK